MTKPECRHRFRLTCELYQLLRRDWLGQRCLADEHEAVAVVLESVANPRLSVSANADLFRSRAAAIREGMSRAGRR